MELPNDEYRALLTKQALECLDEDLRAPHDGRVWAKTFYEQSLQIQQIRLMRELVEELRKVNTRYQAETRPIQERLEEFLRPNLIR